MKKSLITIIVVISALATVGYFLFAVSSPKVCGITDGNVNIHFYDENGNPICTDQGAYSVINGAKGISRIDLGISAINGAGSVPLTCDIQAYSVNGASGSAFDSAMLSAKRVTLMNPGETKEWTSNQFLLSGFEPAPTPDVFSVTIRCTTAQGVIIDQTGTTSLTIQPDGTGSFTVVITPPGGVPQQYCGDGTCNNAETITTCPADCTPTTRSKFRTSDLSYPQGSAVAYGTTCGSALTAFGYESTSCWAVTGATCPVYTGYTNVPSTALPGDPIWANTATPTCLYTKNSDLTRVVVASQVLTTSGSPCGTVGQWGAINYFTGSSYASSVSTSYVTINTLKELTC